MFSISHRPRGLRGAALLSHLSAGTTTNDRRMPIRCGPSDWARRRISERCAFASATVQTRRGRILVTNKPFPRIKTISQHRLAGTLLQQCDQITDDHAFSPRYTATRSRGRQPIPQLDTLRSGLRISTSATLRPASKGRGGTTSAPTSGERRNARRIPPFLGASPSIERRIETRRRSDSGPSSAKRLASDRISSRSVLRPRTSKRAMPRSAKRSRYLSVARLWDVVLTTTL